MSFISASLVSVALSHVLSVHIRQHMELYIGNGGFCPFSHVLLHMTFGDSTQHVDGEVWQCYHTLDRYLMSNSDNICISPHSVRMRPIAVMCVVSINSSGAFVTQPVHVQASKTQCTRARTFRDACNSAYHDAAI